MTDPMPSPAQFDEIALARAAQRLINEGVWVRRDFWVNEDDMEVPEGHPDAVNREYLMEIDYDRIVHLVVDSLTAAPSPAETPAPRVAS